MGLDILLATDNYETIASDPVFFEDSQFSLSRTFYYFMCRRDVVSEIPELDQIGNILKIDIQPFYHMIEYINEIDFQEQLEFVTEEEHKEKFIQQTNESRENVAGNIDQIQALLQFLLKELAAIPDLEQRFEKTERDTLNRAVYFLDFEVDKGDGYIGNNFGQDLRNFERFVSLAKIKGAQMVYFSVG